MSLCKSPLKVGNNHFLKTMFVWKGSVKPPQICKTFKQETQKRSGDLLRGPLAFSAKAKFVVSCGLNPAATKAFVDALRLSRPGEVARSVFHQKPGGLLVDLVIRLETIWQHFSGEITVSPLFAKCHLITYLEIHVLFLHFVRIVSRLLEMVMAVSQEMRSMWFTFDPTWSRTPRNHGVKALKLRNREVSLRSNTSHKDTDLTKTTTLATKRLNMILTYWATWYLPVQMLGAWEESKVTQAIRQKYDHIFEGREMQRWAVTKTPRLYV